jgi:hypothetical protein
MYKHAHNIQITYIYMQHNIAIRSQYQHYCRLGCACIVWQFGTTVVEELARWRLQVTPDCQYLAAKICCITSLGSTCWLSITCHHTTCFGDTSNIIKLKTSNINNANYKVQVVAYYWMSEKHVSQQQVIKNKQMLWWLYISNLNISWTQFSWGVKGGRRLRLTTLPAICEPTV